jgi:hypothetical protein
MRTTYTLGVAYHHPDLIELGHNLERDLAALGVDRYRDYIPPRVYGSLEDFTDMLASLEPRSMAYQGNPADAAFKRKCSGTYECPCERCGDCLPPASNPLGFLRWYLVACAVGSAVLIWRAL